MAIITGTGRAFCSGMDLSAWLSAHSSGNPFANLSQSQEPGNPGIGSLSRRHSKKPIIAAVNGLAIGGGLEIVLNCDLVVASDDAKFGFPEVGRGVVVAAGGIPRGRRKNSATLMLHSTRHRHSEVVKGRRTSGR